MSNHGRDEWPEDCDKNIIDTTTIEEFPSYITKPKEWWEEDEAVIHQKPVSKFHQVTVEDFHELDLPFINKAIEVGKLVGVKNRAYGNAFYDSGKILKILYPKGVSLEQMDDMLAVVRILDKIFRIASEKKALGESPYRDIAGYGILGDVRESIDE